MSEVQNTQTQPTVLQSTSQATEQPKKPHKFWKILVALNLGAVLPSILVIAWASYEQSQGASGTEYIGLMLWPLFVVAFFTLLVDIPALTIYVLRSLRQHNQQRDKASFIKFLLALIVLIALVAYVTIGIFTGEDY